MSGLVTYPAGLPAPTAMDLTPAERRAAEGLAVESTAVASARALQRDFAGTAALSFVFSAAQYAQWLAWWKDDLVYGGAWFSAPTWPFPWGLGGVLRHASAPTVRHLGRGIRQVDVQADVRGASLPPQLRTSFDALLARLMRNLQPMSETPQTPRWEPDTDGDEWFVRPLSALADTPVSRNGYTGELGGAVLDDEFGRLIDPSSIVATSTTLLGADPIPMTAIVWSDDPDSITLRDGQPLGLWACTYNCVASSGDGSSYAGAWAGIASINWAAMAPGDTLWVCGTHEDQTLAVQAAGAAGAYIKIALYHPTDPARIHQGRIVQDTEWVDAGDGEWYLEDAKAPTNMLFEDGVRMWGMSITSRATTDVTAVDIGADTITIRSLRPIYTGTPLLITGNINLTRIPAPLERQVQYYAIVISGAPSLFYTLQMQTYVVKLATSPENAALGTAVGLTVDGDGGAWYLWNPSSAAPYYDPEPGSLEPGWFGYDAINARLYYRPSSGTPMDHEVRWSRDQGAYDGACIFIDGYSYIKVLGGGEYGGLFGVAPVGECNYAHLIPIVARNCTDIVVDGVSITGCRHGVGHREVERMTVRNCYVADSGWHALGSDQVEQVTGCPDLLIERNWCVDIGLRHDWGDTQGIITTPKCDRAIFRRNYIQRNARNEVVINTGTLIVDSSEDVACYLNWSDDFSGVGVVTAPGPDGAIPGMWLVANIFTRGSNPARLGAYPAGPVHGRVGAFQLVNQNTDVYSVTDGRVIGNLVGQCHVPYTATVAPTEHLGHVLLRTTHDATVEIVQFDRNAFVQCTGLIYAFTRWNVSNGTPHGTLVGDHNLYAGVDAFYERWSDTTQDQVYTVQQILDGGSGTWASDTGNDAHAQVWSAYGEELGEPTLQQLQILRLHDAYDTYDLPTASLVGGFPFEG